MKLLFTFLLLSSVCFGQNRKDQIEALNKSIDSLNTVLATTRDNSAKDISLLNDRIKEVTDEVTALKSDLTNLQASNNKLTKENEKLKTDLGELSKKNLELEGKISAFSQDNLDSCFDGNIQSPNSFSKNYKNIIAWDVSYLKFQKYPIPNSKQDILQWLKQFEISSETKVVYDYDVDPEDWKGVVGMHTTIYKNGIMVRQWMSYEDKIVRLDFPFLSVNDAKLLIKQLNLYELATGCFDEEMLEFEFKYCEEIGGTSVYFGNCC